MVNILIKLNTGLVASSGGLIHRGQMSASVRTENETAGSEFVVMWDI